MLVLLVGIKKCEVEVISSNMTFIPNLMESVQG